jgi:hypothetical protein
VLCSDDDMVAGSPGQMGCNAVSRLHVTLDLPPMPRLPNPPGTSRLKPTPRTHEAFM